MSTYAQFPDMQSFCDITGRKNNGTICIAKTGEINTYKGFEPFIEGKIGRDYIVVFNQGKQPKKCKYSGEFRVSNNKIEIRQPKTNFKGELTNGTFY